MKKILCAFALICALAFTGCNVEEMDSLRDITRPYAGEYKCKKLLLGGEDLLGGFEYMKLNLGYYGDFTLSYAQTDAGEGEYSGEYEIAGDRAIFSAEAGGEKKRYVFLYEAGAVIMELPFGGKLLQAEFRAV